MISNNHLVTDQLDLLISILKHIVVSIFSGVSIPKRKMIPTEQRQQLKSNLEELIKHFSESRLDLHRDSCLRNIYDMSSGLYWQVETSNHQELIYNLKQLFPSVIFYKLAMETSQVPHEQSPQQSPRKTERTVRFRLNQFQIFLVLK